MLMFRLRGGKQIIELRFENQNDNKSISISGMVMDYVMKYKSLSLV